jgi:hypothetical protein
MRTQLFVVAVATLGACQTQAPALSEAAKSALADTAKAVVQGAMQSADRLDFDAYFRNFADDADAKYAEAGSLYPSLSEMRKGYAGLVPNFESLAQGMDGWTPIVLAPDAVAFTTPFHFTFKMKGRPEYKGSGVWSGVVQRRAGAWRIVQAHESWTDQDKVIAAMTAPPASGPTKQP